ncbi:Wzz/FepE/Etk N-terminal domain-containing protein [Ferruginibacter sp.]|uniref:Wzz/FepE/Etk N-terminal domain-containing protein n=1 Tax=Ferruginibacter sp. TaxID=1940288 RepID=UPI00265925C2|nr:Wzz/FepE/Etk N-terminal domain-containing protein [Ferruginibacter sp.]
MTSTVLIRSIFYKLKQYKIAVIGCGIFFALLFFFYVRHNRPVYTAKATVFPLSTQSENSISTSALNGILGIEGNSKSFSGDAAINIVELTLSRNVRQKVALTRLPQFDNKTITELIADDLNAHASFWENTIKIPADSEAIASLGGELLSEDITAKMSKNGVLEIYFSSSDKKLITPITNVFIEKLSQFYIDLKISKALADYYFTIKKIDSLQDMLTQVDKKAVVLQNTTYFTPSDRLEYGLPKENLSMEKSRILRQRDLSVNNREEATWRLQKATPIISVLDKPTEPFIMVKTSSVIFGIIGFFAGCFICTLFLISGLIYTYAKSEIYKSVFGDEPELPLTL